MDLLSPEMFLVIRSQWIRKEKLISYTWPNLYTNLRGILSDPTNWSNRLSGSVYHTVWNLEKCIFWGKMIFQRYWYSLLCLTVYR